MTEPEPAAAHSPDAAPAILEPRTRGPQGAGGWAVYVLLGPLVVIVVGLVLFALPLGPDLSSLIAVTAGAYTAGRAAKVKGARWWIASWVLTYVLTLAVITVPLMFLGGAISEILLEATP